MSRYRVGQQVYVNVGYLPGIQYGTITRVIDDVHYDVDVNTDELGYVDEEELSPR